MSDRNAKADSSGDLHEIKVLQAEIERLEAKLTQDPKDARCQLYKATQKWQQEAGRCNAEIKRLREQVVNLQTRNNALYEAIEHHQAVEADQQRAIVRTLARTERLLEELKLHDKAAELSAAENKRLREHIAACSDTCGFQARKIEHLQAALAKSCEEGRDGMYDCGYNRLRAAIMRYRNTLAGTALLNFEKHFAGEALKDAAP